MYQPDSSGNAAAGPGGAAANPRYAYLTGRLRSRQITMEEATELFGLMQGLLRASEAARLLALRATAPAVPPPPPSGPPPPGPMRTVASSSDDFLLMGILAMGAGAGLLAALTKRIQEPAGPARPSASEPHSS